jgi:hypothetical protein
MPPLTSQRCSNHSNREAVARCPECTRFFCRECITEHDDRVLCAACLKKLARKPLARRRWFANLVRLGQCALAVLFVWFFFFVMGERLSEVASSFHEDTMWHVPWADQE